MGSQKNLVIVESPAKAKTIQGYLGKDYAVKSSFGHVRDLPAKKMSVDIAHGFEPQYEVSPEKQKVVSELKKNLGKDTQVWLATDEDREGEAIAWHLSQVLKLKAGNTRRIVFHEITKDAITAAVQNPRQIDKNLVDAQQARRVLDRLVGYEVSPVLWRKVRTGLSAGRVQSVAVRLIVERERAINAHSAERSFKLRAQIADAERLEFSAEYEAGLKSKDSARKVLEKLIGTRPVVTALDQSEGTRNPGPPFTTSTLQQEASHRISYSLKQTMRLAQRLYEAGAITYMRTDSVALSTQSLAAATAFITKQFGADYHQYRTYATTSKGAQEAHEAIRPTDPARERGSTDPKEQKLYELIRGRFLASQMAPARLAKTKAALKCGEVELTAKGEVITFDGWLKVYPFNSISETELPKLSVGDELNLVSAAATETLSRPPARYSEATLVKKLEEMGIGRPSTYAPTISTVQDRGYVLRGPAPTTEADVIILSLKGRTITETAQHKTLGGEKRRLLPTDTAFVVNDFLVKHFGDIVDYDFTASVEEEFDKIEDGKEAWNRMIAEFYEAFHKTVVKAAAVSRQEASQARAIGADPKTKQPIIARYGRYGPMLQRGESAQKDDKEGPKPDFAPLPPGATLESVTLEQALSMFNLPRLLGTDANGSEIKANIGRFGPYVQIEKTYASIPKGEDVFTINKERALELVLERQQTLKKQLIKEFDGGLSIKTGRFGPYVTNGKLNAKIPKGTDPDSLGESDVKLLLQKKAQA